MLMVFHHVRSVVKLQLVCILLDYRVVELMDRRTKSEYFHRSVFRENPGCCCLAERIGEGGTQFARDRLAFPTQTI